MTKQELMENFTMEQLADMVVDLQKERAKMSYEHCDCVCKEEHEKLKEKISSYEVKIDKLEKELKQKDGTKMFETLMENTDGEAADLLAQHMYENLKCVRTNARITDDVSIVDFLPEEPIKVADVLINASYTRIKGELEKKIDKAFGNNSDVAIENVYSVSELRQIAEHLLIYCNAHESEI